LTSTRVIVHAGFHKTGTSSLQNYLGRQRKKLKPFVDIYLKKDFLKAGNLGRRYGLQPYFRRRMQFRFALRAFLMSIPNAENIVLSWEGFSGVMPGHRRLGARTIQSYSRSAIPLAKEIIRELRRRFGDDVQIEFLYTTRASDPWIKSVYGHLSRSIRIKPDLAGFRDQFKLLPDLMQEADLIKQAIMPVPVHTARLEQHGTSRFGPAQAVFDLLDLPPEAIDKLPDAKRINAGQPDKMVAQFHMLNNCVSDARDLKQQKLDILAGR